MQAGAGNSGSDGEACGLEGELGAAAGRESSEGQLESCGPPEDFTVIQGVLGSRRVVRCSFWFFLN